MSYPFAHLSMKELQKLIEDKYLGGIVKDPLRARTEEEFVLRIELQRRLSVTKKE